MRKKIAIISLLLVLISIITILILGREATLEYDISDIDDISISYDKNIIKCKKTYKDNKLILTITPINRGKTELIVKRVGPGTEIVQRDKIYVHFSNLITLKKYFGKCRGDISFVISYLIILVMILIYSIRQLIRGIKKNLYEYRNIRLLGLTLFIFPIFSLTLYLFITDLIQGYNDPLYMFISNLISNSIIFIILMLPIAIITSILVVISNIKLILKEGITWKNMLGIFLGGLILITTAVSIYFYNYGSRYNIYIIFILSSISYIIAVLVAYLECILFGTIILGIISAKKKPDYNQDYIIILGCKIKNDGTLFPLLKSRVDRAIEFAKKQKEKTGKDIIFVPSGGKGNDEIISEADAMKNYLIEQGIDKKKILVENKSTNTYQNIKYSNELISKKDKSANIAFCTTNYHVFRAGNIASNQNIYMKGIGAKTKTYYWINAFIREFIATLVSEKKKHIKTLLIVLVIIIILTIIHYITIIM